MLKIRSLKVRIGNYLRGDLNRDQRRTFEKVLKQSPELQEEMELQQEIQRAVCRAPAYRKFRSTMEQVQKRFFRRLSAEEKHSPDEHIAA